MTNKKTNPFLAYFKRNMGTLIGLALLVVVVAFSTPKFATQSNVLNLFKANSVNAIRTASPDVDNSVQISLMRDISVNLKATYQALGNLEKVTAQAEAMTEGEDQARFYHDVVCEAMMALREPADRLEMLVAKSAWPFPSYGDMIFEV